MHKCAFCDAMVPEADYCCTVCVHDAMGVRDDEPDVCPGCGLDVTDIYVQGGKCNCATQYDGMLACEREMCEVNSRMDDEVDGWELLLAVLHVQLVVARETLPYRDMAAIIDRIVDIQDKYLLA